MKSVIDERLDVVDLGEADRLKLSSFNGEYKKYESMKHEMWNVKNISLQSISNALL
ncbi:hypothetical protein [Falsibacillus albus]|uniref:hypothetical protein n=1 Tax=Falsibacillus albus TaxID=2478915 RepID=UPI0013141324|nr:hypothetical protein [Falsibacillus albus]